MKGSDGRTMSLKDFKEPEPGNFVHILMTQMYYPEVYVDFTLDSTKPGALKRRKLLPFDQVDVIRGKYILVRKGCPCENVIRLYSIV